MKYENESELINTSYNLKGLPCINKGDHFILFNPYEIKAYKISAPMDLSTINTLKQYIDRYDSKSVLNDDASKNLHFTLVMTTDCNLSCRYCYAESRRAILHMDFKLAKEIVQKVVLNYPNRNIFFHFYGGEPTLNFGTLIKLTEFIKENYDKAHLYISTNGRMEQKYLDYLTQNRFSFYLSVDSVESGIIKGNVKNLDAHLEATLVQILNNRLPLKIRVTVCESNVDHMPVLAERLFKNGVKFIQFIPVNRVGFAKKHSEYLPTTEFYDRYLENTSIVLDIAKKYQAKIITPFTWVLKNKPRLYCKGIDENRFIITPEGLRSFCFGVQGEFNSYSNKFISGKFNLEKNEFGYNDILKKEREQNSKIVIGDYCSNCFAQFLCNGGCSLENIYATNSLTKLSEEWCYFHKRYAYFLINRLIS